MTCLEKLKKDHPEMKEFDIGWESRDTCPDDHGYLSEPSYCCEDNDSCKRCWGREIPEAKASNLIIGDEKVEHPDTDIPKTEEKRMIYAHIFSPESNDSIAKEPEWPEEAIDKFNSLPHEQTVPAKDIRKILDSGDRTKFPSGAVRDLREGKGRCDLMPLDVVSEFTKDAVTGYIYNFQETGDVDELYNAWDSFAEQRWHDNPTMFLEVAIHFEDGGKKYGDDNWQKGIPVRCYIDSAVRHYLKFLRGDKDEPHDRAFVWNLMCAIWTCKHKPSLNDYAVSKMLKETGIGKYDPVYRAYKTLTDDPDDVQTAIGYLGEALDE